MQRFVTAFALAAVLFSSVVPMQYAEAFTAGESGGTGTQTTADSSLIDESLVQRLILILTVVLRSMPAGALENETTFTQWLAQVTTALTQPPSTQEPTEPAPEPGGTGGDTGGDSGGNTGGDTTPDTGDTTTPPAPTEPAPEPIVSVCEKPLRQSPGRTVTVGTVTELRNAIKAAKAEGGMTILLRDGTYDLAREGNVGIVVDANNVTIKSASGNRNGVIIKGNGMFGTVSHGFWIMADNVTLADLTIGWLARHPIQVNGEKDADGLYVRNVRFVDGKHQLLKVSYNASNASISSDNGVVECSLFEFTKGHASDWYTGGIDAHNAKNWIVRNNVFKGIRSPERLTGTSGRWAEHAIHFWSNSENTLVERNVILNSDRGIGFGLGNYGRGHIGGVIRNNVIYHNNTPSTIGIGLESAKGAKVYNNTVYYENANTQGMSYAIDYRFKDTNADIANNLTNRPIYSRDGGIATVRNNVTNAQLSWFRNIRTGDATLTSAISSVVNKGVSLSAVTDDVREALRDAQTDIGAFEWNGTTLVGQTPAPAPTQPTSPTNGDTGTTAPAPAGTLNKSDIVYQGSFALPNPSDQASRFAYGGYALAYKPAANGKPESLFISGHDHHQLVAEVAIPIPLRTTNASALPVAKIIQPFTDITGGLKNSVPEAKLGGLLVDNGNLLWTVYKYYNVDGTNLKSHGVSSANFGALNARGLWGLGNFHMQRTAGYLAAVPDAWQSKFGFPYLSGASTRAGRATSSDGPAAFGFNPWQSGALAAGNTNLQSDDFLWYSVDNRATYTFGTTAHEWKGSNTVSGMAFPVSKDKTKSAVAYFVSLGTYPTDWYGEPQNFPGTACSSGKGYHGGPYRAEIWLYNPNDLLAVKNGTREPWELQPYQRVDITPNLFNQTCSYLGGVGYDEIHNKLYVVEMKGYPFNAYERTPVVHVYSVL